MRCKYFNGVIIYTPSHSYYPEYWHCFNCGQDVIDEERSSSIAENLERNKPRKRRYTKRKDYW